MMSGRRKGDERPSDVETSIGETDIGFTVAGQDVYRVKDRRSTETAPSPDEYKLADDVGSLKL